MQLKQLAYELGREFAKGVREELNASSVMSCTDDSKPVSEAFREYHQHKCLLGEWKRDTENRAEVAFELFVEIVGDKQLGDLTRQDGRTYLGALLRLPANRNKKAKYRDFSVPDLLRMDIPEVDRWRKRTVNHTLKWVHGCFEWCRKEGLIESNPLLGLHVKEDDSVPYRPFTNAELTKLFSHPLYADPTYPKRWRMTYKFWTPLLGLYTGARLGELCQLRVSDVVQSEEGVWYLNIVDEEEHQTIKTSASKRKTPIAGKLLELGFLDYCQVVKASGENMLFPDLIIGQRGWQQYASRQFATMLNQQGFKRRTGLCFHSFRKNAVDAIAANAPRDSLVSAVVGHAQLGMTFSRYFSEYPLEELKVVVDLIDYGVDLTPLKGGWKRFLG